jgi:hypothetical protein
MRNLVLAALLLAVQVPETREDVSSSSPKESSREETAPSDQDDPLQKLPDGIISLGL